RIGESSSEAMEQAVRSMTTLNRYAAEVFKKYDVHACTDITGFGFLGHLLEMVGDEYGAEIDSLEIPYIREAVHYANEFFITAAAQKNRNHLGDRVLFKDVPFAMEEILFDPQTSGGLLVSLPREDAMSAIAEIESLGMPCGIVGRITHSDDKRIIVK
ncbi:MAG: selenide, water dikinase SelD, partial [Youngiibacter sp.]|nr:selenide, water dikinase SelD [Youngiibacter sp.]